VAAGLLDTDQLVSVARGYLLAAARETALKLRETSGTLAEGWSAADLRHGPVAAIDAACPSSACAPPGRLPPIPSAWRPNWSPGRHRAARQRRRRSRPPPSPGVPEALANIGSVVRGQHLARLVSLGAA